MAPLLIAMLLFVVGLGRLASTREVVDGAARDAARQASVRRSPERAAADARSVATDTLAGRDVTCRELAVDVACRVALADVALSGLPGQQWLRRSFVAPVDRFRGDNR